jgi:hypothetical protein
MKQVLLALILAQTDSPSFIDLHAPGQHKIAVNIDEISTVRDPRGNGHFAHDVHCVVVMTNKSFIGVAESCNVVREMMKQLPSSHGPCTLVCGGEMRP